MKCTVCKTRNTRHVSKLCLVCKNAAEAAGAEEPKLVINLLRSRGTIDDIMGNGAEGLVSEHGEYLEHGRVRGVLPWRDHEAALRAEKRLDAFMEEVLIPIAASANAIVFADCLKGDCFLSSSFNRVMALQASRHATPPITVINFSCDLEILYHNRDKNAAWRELRDKSKAWRQREEKSEENNIKGIKQLIREQPYFKKWSEFKACLSCCRLYPRPYIRTYMHT